MNKSIALIILNLNGKEIIKICLNSISEKTKHPNVITIVVDNGSSDGSIEMVKNTFPFVKILENSTNLGYPRGNNQGIRSVTADYYLLLNNDTKINTEGWLIQLLEPFDDPKVGIVGCKTISFNEDIPIHLKEEPMEVAWVSGVSLMIRKETIQQIGVLDEGFSPFLFEDKEWCYRARIAGWKVVKNPRVIILHDRETTTSKIGTKSQRYYYLIVRNRIRFGLLVLSSIDFMRSLLGEVKTFGSAILKGSRIERNSKLRNLFRAYFFIFFNLRQILSRRHAIQGLEGSVL